MSESDFHTMTKIHGYLEKRSKLKLCNWWRKQYFILEGKTLWCAKSKDDYREDRKSTAKIVVHFGKVNGVRPVHSSHTGSGRFQFEIITKGTSIVLATTDEESRSRWLSALQDALQQSDISPPLKKKHPTVSTQSMVDISSSTFYLFEKPKDHSISHPDLSPSRGPQLAGQSLPTLNYPYISTKNSIKESQNHPIGPDTIESKKGEAVEVYQPPDLIVDCSKPVVTMRNKNNQQSLPTTTVDRQTVVLRDCLKLKLLSLPTSVDCRPSSSLIWRASEVEFFWSDKNADWPALSMDLCDELLEDIRRGRLLSDTSLVVELKDMDTQTDFQDDIEYLNAEHVRVMRDELISYISTSSSAASSIANTPTDGVTVRVEDELANWGVIDEGSGYVAIETVDSDYDFASASESCYITAESSDGEL